MGNTCGKVEKEVPKNQGDNFALNKRDLVRVKTTNIRNDYSIGDKIGNEKFAALHKCKSKQTGQRLLVKIFSVTAIEPKALESFIQEAELLREADHPNIIKVIDIYKDETNAYIVTEYCKGGELLERITELGSLSENKVASYMKQIISAVVYLHSKRIIHRDLRLENVMFLNKDKDSCLKLVEFGSCKHFEKNVRVLERVGSPYFMSPEVILGNFDSKCDVWSLGVMIYVLLSGSTPFVGSTETEIMQSVLTSELLFEGKKWKKISNEAKNLIRSLLNRNSKERPNAKHVLNDPWIKQRAENKVADNEIISSTLSNLNQFDNQSKLQRATLAFIVSQIMSSDDVGALQNVFKEIDSNGDGLLSKKEIRKALESNTGYSDNDIEILISKVDLDQNGLVNYSEFLAATVDWNKEMSRDRLVQAFKALDADHSGKISKEELMAAFGGSHTSSKIFKEMINEADIDGDGEIDLEEFCTYMENFKERVKS
ncbi:hypothetical protein SteCoe_30681 [Stentor coeruleus]|uniref:non-specific serine/threonine protein kinase n=1 Tax=Stentor coeruleus TaxID=5963 RepID=A0A1R2B3C2_9CILI|nr:hypothetical protein SteCoe_30681 [Stentor coeruleus]